MLVNRFKNCTNNLANASLKWAMGNDYGVFWTKNSKMTIIYICGGLVNNSLTSDFI